MAAFPGGVWFVELAPAGGPGVVGRAALKAMGATETPGVAPAEVAAVGLGDREPVVGDPGQLRAPGGGVRGLRVHGAAAQPGGDGARDQPRAARRHGRDRMAGAVAVVAARPTRFRRSRRCRSTTPSSCSSTGLDGPDPSFVVNDVNAPAIAQICHRLDGIPLAVELAAARCRHLSTEQIAVELDDRFHLLTGGPRVVLPRQQTLAASVEWSYDLLDDVECRVLRRLGVFAGRVLARSSRGHRLGGRRREPDRGVRHDQSPRRQELGVGRRVRRLRRLGSLPVAQTIRAFAVNRARDAGELAGLRAGPRRLVVRTRRGPARHRPDRRRDRNGGREP